MQRDIWSILRITHYSKCMRNHSSLRIQIERTLPSSHTRMVSMPILRSWTRKTHNSEHWIENSGRSCIQFSSTQLLSHVRLFASPWITARQASWSITNSGIYPNSCPLSQWCHPTISSSVASFSSCPQSFPASGSSPMSQLFASGGQSTGVLASTSVLPMNTQDWSALGWTGGSPCSPRDSQESSPTPQFKSINSLVLSFLYSPTLTSIHDHWKNHSLISFYFYLFYFFFLFIFNLNV